MFRLPVLSYAEEETAAPPPQKPAGPDDEGACPSARSTGGDSRPTPSDPAAPSIEAKEQPQPSSSKNSAPPSKPGEAKFHRGSIVRQVSLRLCEVNLGSPEELWSVCLPLSSAEFLECCEERALEGRCGFPLCPHVHVKTRPKGGYVVREGTYGTATFVMDDKAPPDFCSLECAQRAVRFAALLGDSFDATERAKKALKSPPPSASGPSTSGPPSTTSTPTSTPTPTTLDLGGGVHVPVAPWEGSRPPVQARTEARPSTSAQAAGRGDIRPKPKRTTKKLDEPAGKAGSGVAKPKEAARPVLPAPTPEERRPGPPTAPGQVMLPDVVEREAGPSEALAAAALPSKGAAAAIEVEGYIPKHVPPAVSAAVKEAAAREKSGAGASAGAGLNDADAINRLMDAFWHGVSISKGKSDGPVYGLDSLLKPQADLTATSARASDPAPPHHKPQRRPRTQRPPPTDLEADAVDEGAETSDEDGEEQRLYEAATWSGSGSEGGSDDDRGSIGSRDEDSDALSDTDCDGGAGSLSDVDAAAADAALSRRLALLEQWAGAGCWAFLGRPPRAAAVASASPGPSGRRRPRTHVDEHGVEYTVVGESDDDLSEEEIDVEGSSDTLQGHQVRMSLLGRLSASVPRVLRAAESTAPVQPVCSALSDLLLHMRFKGPVPGLPSEDYDALCCAMMCALTRHHLPGLAQPLGVSEATDGGHLSVSPPPALRRALGSWACDARDLDTLVEALTGGAIVFD